MTPGRPLILAGLMIMSATMAAAQGYLAHWDFTAGRGAVLRDRVGEANGRIVNAVWVKTPQGNALRFDGAGDYVELGGNLPARMAQGFSVLAWLRLQASPFPNTTTNYTLLDCERYLESGFQLRIDGATGKPYFRTSQAKGSTGNFATRAVTNQKEQCLVLTYDAAAGVGRFYLDGVFAGETALKAFAPATAPLRLSLPEQSFQGDLREMRVYDRCLSYPEVLAEFQSGAGAGVAAWRGKLRLTPFYYGADRELVARVNALGVLPLAAGDEIAVELVPRGGQPVQTQTLPELPPAAELEVTLGLEKLPPGAYELRAVQRRAGKVVTQTGVSVQHPPAAPVVPSPGQATAGNLPAPAPPLPYTLATTPAGGLTLRVGSTALAVESAFSYPRGGDNTLPADLRPGAEPDWRVSVGQNGPRVELQAEGRSYRLARRIVSEPHRLVFRDTLTNKTAEPLGLILAQGVRLRQGEFTGARLGGNGALGPVSDLKVQSNPTVFLSRPGLGVGLVALDDVSIVQARGSYEGTGGSLGSKSFALDAGASYTLEWALYLNASGDYYDFINAVRRDEGRNGVTVAGGFSFYARDQVPPAEFVANRNLKYLSAPCMSAAPDDPEVSIEGIEFMDFPGVRRLLGDNARAVRARYPDLHLMFHIAHSLYATNVPAKLFPDARVLRADGSQVMYGYNYEGSGYFSKQRLADNWRWWIFYPTLQNSFFQAMMRSVDVMMDEMGMTGAFLDGYMVGYGDEFTYDRWDGHTAEIDPATRTLTARPGNVLLLSQDAMAAYSRKILDKGGVVIANNAVITRTIGKLPLIVDNEINEGPMVHLAQTTACLGDTFAAQCEADIHTDILNKLRWGNLYFYYGGDRYIQHRLAPARMYPFTLRELHEGTLIGEERVITSNSGVYGWPVEPASRDLHQVYLFDTRGREVPAHFLTTADAQGVRTRLDLGERQLAIVRRVPIILRSPAPVNVLVTQYEAEGVQLRVHGTGQLRFTLRDGDFSVPAGQRFVVEAGRRQELTADSRGRLSFEVAAEGPLTITVRAAR